MELVNTEEKKFVDYLQFIDGDTLSKLNYFIDCLKGKKIAMINATAYGGGVAEKLHSMVPIMKDMGLDVDWWKIYGEEEFFNVTKIIHNCLQGEEGELTEDQKEVYLKYIKYNASLMKEWDYDFTVVHDPQPAALIHYLKDKNSRGKWIWRCHIDTSTPNKQYWDFIHKFISNYDAVIFTMEEYVGENLQHDNQFYITPSIDPLSYKNIILTREEALKVISNFGIDTDRPLVTQVSRFDPWKDPLGVIDVYRIVKKEHPDVQLALVGSMAADDPEGWDYLYKTLRKAGEDYDIKIITNFNGITSLEVNAFQTFSNIILQKSIKEGFGLTVAEALWKGTPVIGGNVGGIRLQIENGVTGYLINTVEECAEKVLTLLRNPMLAREMAQKGEEKVRKEYLITKNILDYLMLFYKLNGELG